MQRVRRIGSVVAFPELAAARERRARREAGSGLVMIALAAAFVVLFTLLLGGLIRAITWVGVAIWDHLPGLAPSPDALSQLSARLFG